MNKFAIHHTRGRYINKILLETHRRICKYQNQNVGCCKSSASLYSCMTANSTKLQSFKAQVRSWWIVSSAQCEVDESEWKSFNNINGRYFL
jgi:hypothetical protein